MSPPSAARALSNASRRAASEFFHGEAQALEGAQVVGDDFVHGPVVGAEEAFAGELGGAHALFQGFVLRGFFHGRFLPVQENLS